MEIWNPHLQGGNLVRTIKGHGNPTWSTTLFGVLSNDFLATCSLDKEGKEESVLTVHDPSSGRKTKSVPTVLKDASPLLVLSNDQVVIGFDNGSIKIFDLNGGETRSIDRAHVSFVTSLLQFPNGNLSSESA